MNENDRHDELEAQIRAALARKRPQPPAKPAAPPPQPVILSAGMVKPSAAGQPTAAPQAAPQPAVRTEPQPASGGMVPDPSERLGSPAPSQPPEQLRARFTTPMAAPAQPAAPVAPPEPAMAAPAAAAAPATTEDGRRALGALLARSAGQPNTGDTQIPPPPGQVLGRIGVDQQPAPAAPKEKPYRHPFFTGKRHLWPMLIIPFVSITIVLILFYVIKYEVGGEGVVDIAPLIEAEQTPLKVRPEEEGGMEIPNQDMEIFSEIDGESAGAPAAEQLVPEPEQPVVPEPAETAAATTDETATGSEPTGPVVAAPSLEPAATQTAETTEATATDAAADAAATATATGETAATDAAATTEATEPAQPEPVAVTTALPAGAIRIQLAAVRSEEGARATWKELQAKLPELADLQLHIERIDLGGNGIFYRVQGGPLSDKTAAYNLCAALGARGQDCLVVKP